MTSRPDTARTQSSRFSHGPVRAASQAGIEPETLDTSGQRVAALLDALRECSGQPAGQQRQPQPDALVQPEARKQHPASRGATQQQQQKEEQQQQIVALWPRAQSKAAPAASESRRMHGEAESPVTSSRQAAAVTPKLQPQASSPGRIRQQPSASGGLAAHPDALAELLTALLQAAAQQQDASTVHPGNAPVQPTGYREP